MIFLALIFCLPSAADLNESIRGFAGTKYATEIQPLFACRDDPLILMAFIRASSEILEGKKNVLGRKFAGWSLMMATRSRQGSHLVVVTVFFGL